jgi:hypothetical protein
MALSRAFRRARPRVVAGALSLVVVGSLVAAAPRAATRPAEQVPDAAPTEAAASMAARLGHRSVLVESKMDETTEVRANPDGSFTALMHARPVRVRRAGTWVDVDTTLVRAAGTISPKATELTLALSAGGPGPLVTVGKDGAEVGLSWPGDLPEPTLDGPTATYPEVLPGVDLRITADTLGFSQVLVVKTPQAARNPALRRITFGSHARGLTVSATPGGMITATDASGTVVFTGDASRMWDSSGEATGPERLRGSGTGLRTASMGVEVTDSAVTIVPDQKFLSAKDTAYPVYLDPSYYCTSCGKTHHAVVQQAFPDAHNLDNVGGNLGDLKAGRWCVTGDCPLISRTYVSINTSQLVGKAIDFATFHADIVSSAECGAATPTQLSLTGGIDWNTTWNHQPGVVMWQGTSNATNNPGSCPSAGGMDLYATDAAWYITNNGIYEATFMLSGSREDNSTSWRRFNLNPYLVAKYNSYPNPPDWMGMEGFGPGPNDALGCTVGAGRSFVATRTPRLRARLSDPDGGILGAGFRVFKGLSNNYTWDGNETATTGVPSGSFAEVTIPSGIIPSDGVYTWHLYSTDGGLSSWAPLCEMEVDTVAPGMPGVSSPEYPNDRPAGRVGQPGTFTFTANAAVDGVAYYLYAFTTQGGVPSLRATPATVNGQVSVQWTPALSGPQTLAVQAVDRAGNRSAVVRYNVVVSDYQVGISGKVAQWSFESSLRDTAGGKLLSYQGPPPGPTYDAGQQNRGVTLNPDRTEFYQAKDALVRTDTSFTVSAWAKLTRTDRSYAIAAQDGDRMSGFYLQYHKDLNRWAAVMSDRDSEVDTRWYYAASANPPVLNQWTHLAAVFDAATGKLRLYVDGAMTEAAAPPAPWNGKGVFTVGVAKGSGQRTQYFAGGIDSVRVHSRALSAAELDALRAGTATANPTAEYLFENNLENTGANNDLLPSTAATYEPGYAGNAARFGTTPDRYLALPGPLVNTTGSYSVAAWVRLDDKAGYYHVAAQEGTAMSGFMFRYSPDVDRWIFGTPTRDENSTPTDWAIGTSSPQAGVWTHVAAVHDAAAHRISLYVNGIREAERAVSATIDASGQFLVGVTKSNGVRTGRFNGLMDEVNVFDGALNATEVARLANQPVERARYRLAETSGTVAGDTVAGAQANLYGASVSFGQNYGAASARFSSSGTENTGTVAGAGPLARWELNGTLTDATGNGHVLLLRNATVDIPATYAAVARIGQGITLNGVDQRLTAATLVDTTRTYSVSAWVKPDRADSRSYTVASQDGPTASTFSLEYLGDQGRWAFSVAEASGGTLRRAVSTSPPVPSMWAHLLGVYDQAAGRVRLYVNGHLEAEVAVTAGSASNGSFALGRAKRAGGPVDFFPGTLDEVRVYDRALTAADARGLWDLGSAIVAPRPAAFRTEQSFTIAAWARPDGFDNAARIVLSVGADLYSPVMISYQPDWKRWMATALNGSESQVDMRRVLSDNEASTYQSNPGGWVHLAAVYDAPARKLRLYVNGIPQSTVPDTATTVKKDPNAGSNTTLWDSGRDLQVGRIIFYGIPTNHWWGAIRDVRVFSGVPPEACDNGVANCMSQLPWQ